MYEIIKSVIAAGGYKLTEIQHKVKKLYNGMIPAYLYQYFKK